MAKEKMTLNYTEKMQKFEVVLVETVEHKITVEASDKSDIENKVCDMLARGLVDFAKGKTVKTQLLIEK